MNFYLEMFLLLKYTNINKGHLKEEIHRLKLLIFLIPLKDQTFEIYLPLYNMRY